MGSDGTPNTGIQTYLQVLNSIRNRHGAAALTWNGDLDAKAQQWARTVANSSILGGFWTFRRYFLVDIILDIIFP